jgi:hypothetical protein
VLFAHNYRNEAIAWRQMGEALPKDGLIMGITHDSNRRLGYYGWVPITGWPQVGDLAMLNLAGGNNDVNDPAWRTIFLEKTKGYSYFLVTLFSELNGQPVLKSVLDEYPSTKGDGYILFDLRKKKD